MSLVRLNFRVLHVHPLGTVGKDYTFRDAFDLVSTVTAPCGATTVLNVNSDLRVNNGANSGGRGLITTDSVGSIYFICVLLLKFYLLIDRWLVQAGVLCDIF